MRLIDADALKQHIDKLPALPDGNFAGNHSALKALINMQLPIDAVPVKHGRWKEDPSGYGFWICSACGFVSEASAADMLYKFCPNCGADMRKDGEHEKAD